MEMPTAGAARGSRMGRYGMACPLEMLHGAGLAYGMPYGVPVAPGLASLRGMPLNDSNFKLITEPES